jgi:hypothetical protein
LWDSSVLTQGQTFSFTFTQAGTFPYFCEVHPNMTATIAVGQPGASGSQLPPQPPPGNSDDYGY